MHQHDRSATALTVVGIVVDVLSRMILLLAGYTGRQPT
jgi:hypothetical protein